MNSRKTILLIDDDPDVLSFLRNTIASDKFRVITAMSGLEGLNKFNIEKPDLVIYEMIKEEESFGMETVRAMRKKDKDVKIYILGNISPGIEINPDVHKFGADGMLQKPINPDKLMNIVKGVMIL